MKLFEVSSSFGVVIQKFANGQFDPEFVCQKEGKSKFQQAGHFTKQEDGAFEFVFPTDQDKRNFAEIIQSENPIETFNRIYRK